MIKYYIHHVILMLSCNIDLMIFLFQLKHQNMYINIMPIQNEII